MLYIKRKKFNLIYIKCIKIQIMGSLKRRIKASNTEIFIDSIKDGDLNIMKKMLNENVKNIDYALRIASDFNQIEIVKYLLNEGARVDRKRNISLKNAVKNGYALIVDCLLKYGGDITNDLLITACHFEYEEIIILLLTYGAKINNTNELDNPFLTAVQKNNVKIIKIFINYSKKFRLLTSLVLQKALKIAIIEQRYQIIKLIIDYNPDVLIRSNDFKSTKIFTYTKFSKTDLEKVFNVAINYKNKLQKRS